MHTKESIFATDDLGDKPWEIHSLSLKATLLPYLFTQQLML